MEFPAGIMVIILLLRAGRRLTLLILYVICGLALLGTTIIPKYVFLDEKSLVCKILVSKVCICFGEAFDSCQFFEKIKV